MSHHPSRWKLDENQLRLKPRLKWMFILFFALLSLFGIGGCFWFFEQKMASFKDILLSYFVAFLFVLTIGLGCLFFVILQHITASKWSVSIRRIPESALPVLGWLVVLSIPIFFYMKEIYAWSLPISEQTEAIKHLLEKKGAYLNTKFFTLRSIVYWILWCGMGAWLYLRSRRLDKTKSPLILSQMRKVSAVGMVLFAVSIAFAGFDWVMSIDPTFSSTIFGVYIFAGALIASLAFISFVVVCIRMGRSEPLERLITVEHQHDLGKLMFGFVIFWAYIAYSQYFLVWYGNLTEETHWFAKRWFSFSTVYEESISMERGVWAYLTIALIVCHFLIPLFGLISRQAKRSKWVLFFLSALLLIAHYQDIYWLVVPELSPNKSSIFGWTDVFALCAVLGTSAIWFVWFLGRGTMVPVGDPYLKQSAEFENV